MNVYYQRKQTFLLSKMHIINLLGEFVLIIECKILLKIQHRM
jgi:hypothetical protein